MKGYLSFITDAHFAHNISNTQSFRLDISLHLEATGDPASVSCLFFVIRICLPLQVTDKL